MNKIFLLTPFIVVLSFPIVKQEDIKKIVDHSVLMSFWASMYEIDSCFFIKEKVFKDKFLNIFTLNIDSINSVKINYININFKYDGIDTLIDKSNEVYIEINYSMFFINKNINLGARIKNG